MTTAAGIAVPSWMQGRDILAKDYQKRDAVFAARDRCDVTVDRIRSVRADPFETRNLAGDPAFESTLNDLRKRLDRWMVETRDPGPESEEAYDASHAYELKNARTRKQRDAMIENNARTKQWAREGK